MEADGCTWEVRVVAAQGEQDPDTEILEFRPREAVTTRPPRRLAVASGTVAKMKDDELRAAYLKARPIGADFYGRPGKRMHDAG
jgi:hypothetical protein